MNTYNLTINFNAEHVKPAFYSEVPDNSVKEDTLGLIVWLGNGTRVLYPWTSIQRYDKQLNTK